MNQQQASDIETAMGRMRTKIGGRRELERLDQHLWPDERVSEITTGYYGGGTGLIVLTDRRLLFFRDGWFAKESEDFPMEKVSSVSFSTGLMLGSIAVHASGNKAVIENVNKDDGKRIVDNMRAHLSAPKSDSERQASASSSSKADPVEQLRRLGELRDSGVVTPDEFEAKKKELLSRL